MLLRPGGKARYRTSRPSGDGWGNQSTLLPRVMRAGPPPAAGTRHKIDAGLGLAVEPDPCAVGRHLKTVAMKEPLGQRTFGPARHGDGVAGVTRRGCPPSAGST